MNLKEFFQSKTFRTVLYTIGVLVIILAIFQAGMFVGIKRALFFYGDGMGKYNSNIDERQGNPFFGMERGDFPNTHGTIGKIIKISLPTFVIADQDNVEKVVLIDEDSLVRELRGDIKATELKVDDFVVVMGTPNDKSQIEAKLVRVMPAPPSMPPLPMPEQK